MNKNYSKKIALGLLLSVTVPSIMMAEGFYVSSQLGVSKQINDSQPYGNNIATDSDFPSKFEADTGFVGSIGLGYQFNDNFRLESRLAYHNSDIDDRRIGTGARDGSEYILKGEIKSTTLTVEAFYDFVNQSAFTPYVKGGMGVAFNKYSAKLGGAGVAAFDPFDGTSDGYYDNYSDDDSTEFTWNIGVGTSYKISNNMSLYAEYQYVSFGDMKTGQDSFTDGFEIDDSNAHEVAFGLRVNF